MRFALRNQRKIAASLGEDYLDLLMKSLKEYFEKHEVIQEHEIESGKYKCVFVPSAKKNSEIEFQFVIVRKMFDVYNLAYYSSIG